MARSSLTYKGATDSVDKNIDKPARPRMSGRMPVNTLIPRLKALFCASHFTTYPGFIAWNGSLCANVRVKNRKFAVHGFLRPKFCAINAPPDLCMNTCLPSQSWHHLDSISAHPMRVGSRPIVLIFNSNSPTRPVGRRLAFTPTGSVCDRDRDVLADLIT